MANSELEQTLRKAISELKETDSYRTRAAEDKVRQITNELMHNFASQPFGMTEIVKAEVDGEPIKMWMATDEGRNSEGKSVDEYVLQIDLLPESTTISKGQEYFRVGQEITDFEGNSAGLAELKNYLTILENLKKGLEIPYS